MILCAIHLDHLVKSQSLGPLQVILATIKGLQGQVRLSKRVLQKAILHFYSERQLFPRGVVAEMDSAREWALKMGRAIKRLVLCSIGFGFSCFPAFMDRGWVCCLCLSAFVLWVQHKSAKPTSQGWTI